MNITTEESSEIHEVIKRCKIWLFVFSCYLTAAELHGGAIYLAWPKGAEILFFGLLLQHNDPGVSPVQPLRVQIQFLLASSTRQSLPTTYR